VQRTASRQSEDVALFRALRQIGIDAPHRALVVLILACGCEFRERVGIARMFAVIGSLGGHNGTNRVNRREFVRALLLLLNLAYSSLRKSGSAKGIRAEKLASLSHQTPDSIFHHERQARQKPHGHWFAVT